ncbi:MAG: 2-oxoacid ferredoxin oxidoreductase, partial [Deltaproteobacteria bacterium]|nr:2-oxoacid ferredoxin oxidoreductase [Deltaproteobacteria bacterium]
TFQWYKARVYEIEKEPDYDPENELWAYQKAKEWGERIPIGIIFKRPRPLLGEAHRVLQAGPLVKQKGERPIKDLLSEFF